ncbi:hypothetical protein PHLCEN_2v9276 [Hermanssonia centrifuga]|uniref:Uncharacterized protein n=1 Tax=Hermanssonia centrifuga TaxID=98765 RepID=A0A2R6NR72_9APHY|nr:hypothetical protein PHLCEN_2v9276 [Hermanssonia centrifuga]
MDSPAAISPNPALEPLIAQITIEGDDYRLTHDFWSILVLRIYAMYACNKKILTVLLALLCIELVAEIIIITFISSQFTGTSPSLFPRLTQSTYTSPSPTSSLGLRWLHTNSCRVMGMGILDTNECLREWVVHLGRRQVNKVHALRGKADPTFGHHPPT